MRTKTPYIIAEIGINHDGNLKRAINLIKLAKRAGVHAVKFQLFKPETLAKKDKKKKSNFKMWKKYALNKKKITYLLNYSKKIKIDFFCSVFDTESLNIVEKLKIKKIKIASSDVTDLELLKKISKINKNVFLSVGMSNFSEIKEAYKILNNKITLLHCVSLYPCPIEKANLRKIITLRKKFKCEVGYSDHCKGIEASVVAITMGASVIEKHFTDDKNRKGADHILSADFNDMSTIVNFSKNYSKLLGNGKIKPSNQEMYMRKIARKSIYYKKNYNKNHKIKYEDLIIRRPLADIEPKQIYKLLNRKLKTDVKENQSVKFKHLV